MPAVTTTSLDKTAIQDPQNAQPKPQLPYVQPNNTLLPVVPKQPATAQDLQQGSNNVMQAAQQTALQKAGQPDQTMGMVQQGVQELIKNPMGGAYDAKKVNQNQIEQYDRNRAQSMQAFQQQNADVANTGINREAAYNFAMQGAQGRSDLESKLQSENADKERAAMLDALKLGTSTAQAQSGLDTEAFNRLINARGAYEGERSQTQAFQDNTALTNLGFDHQMQLSAQQQGFNLETMNQQFGNEMTKLMASQNWSGAQASLDREAAVVAQSTDINAKTAFAEKQNAFDMAKLNATQDWQGAQNKITQDLQIAMQANDINATSSNIQKQLDLDKWKQQNGQAFTAEQTAMNRALETSLKTMDIDSQRELMGLKAEIDKGTQLRGQDFETVQASLDRAQQTAMQSGDIQAQKDITVLKGQLDAQAQAAQQQWQSNERVASEGWQTTERMDAQQFESVNKQLDRELTEATQANDIAAQERLTRYKGALELKMQTQAMGQEEKMAYLGAQLAEAKANKDVVREKNLLTFEHGQEMQKIVQEQGFVAGQAYLDRTMQQAMQDKDAALQKVLQVQRLTTQAAEAAKDRTLESARIALQGKQIDMQGQQMTFDQIEAAIAAGQIDPQAAAEALKLSAGKLGITINAPDPNAIYAELERDYQVQQYQFAMTNRDQANWDDAGNFVSLKDEGAQAFNDYLSKTYYGEDGKPTYEVAEVPASFDMAAATSGIKISGATADATELAKTLYNADNSDNPNNMAYQKLLAAAPKADIHMTSDANNEIGGVPALGVPTSVNGRLVVVTREKFRQTAGRDTDEFSIMDIATGITKTFNGLSANSAYIGNLAGWLAGL